MIVRQTRNLLEIIIKKGDFTKAFLANAVLTCIFKTSILDSTDFFRQIHHRFHHRH